MVAVAKPPPTGVGPPSANMSAGVDAMAPATTATGNHAEAKTKPATTSTEEKKTRQRNGEDRRAGRPEERNAQRKEQRAASKQRRRERERAQREDKVAGTPHLAPQQGPHSKAQWDRATASQPTPRNTVAQTSTATKSTWDRAAVTRKLLDGFASTRQPTRRAYPDEEKYAAEYACAREVTNTLANGTKREMTDLQKETLFLWRTGELKLAGPPMFIEATMTLRERGRMWDIHRNHLMSRLYVKTKAGFWTKAASSKFAMCITLLGMNEAGEITDPAAAALVFGAHSIRWSPDSARLELLYIRPEERDALHGRTVNLPGGQVLLVATDAFTEEDPTVGFDAGAKAILFVLKLIGGEDLSSTQALAIGEALSEGIEILTLVPTAGTGTRKAEEFAWVYTFQSTAGPAGLVNIRELQVRLQSRLIKFQVHQPRLADYPACTSCLHDWHRSAKCPMAGNTPEAEAARAEKRAPRVLAIELQAPEEVPPDPKPSTRGEWETQLHRAYVRLEPALFKARKEEAVAAASAITAEVDLARAEAHKEQVLRDAALLKDAGEPEGGGTISSGDNAAETRKRPTRNSARKAKRQAAAADAAKRTMVAEAEAKQAAEAAVAAQLAVQEAMQKEAEQEARAKAAIADEARKQAQRDAAELANAQALAAKAAAEHAARVEQLKKIAEAAAAKAHEMSGANSTPHMGEEKSASHASAGKAAADAPNARSDGLKKTKKKHSKSAKRGTSDKRSEEHEGQTKPPSITNVKMAAELATRSREEAEELARTLVQAAVEAALAAAAAAQAQAQAEAAEKELASHSDTSGEDRRADEMDEEDWDWPGESAAGGPQRMEDAGSTRKRERANTSENQTASTIQTTRPPTRQARANTAHRYVGTRPLASLVEEEENQQPAEDEQGGLTEESDLVPPISDDAGKAAQAGEPGEAAEHSNDWDWLEDGDRGADDAQGSGGEDAASEHLQGIGKRERAESTDASAAATRPPTRQARVNTAHECVGPVKDAQRTQPSENVAPESLDEDGHTPKVDAGGKRTRVDSSDDPTRVLPVTARPPTRQARANTAHKCVGDPDGAAKVKQLSVAPFLRRVEAAQAHTTRAKGADDWKRVEAADCSAGAAEEGSVRIVLVVPATDAQARIRFPALCKKLGLREVATPPNGSCLQAAIYAAQALSCASSVSLKTRSVCDKVQGYRSDLPNYLVTNLAALEATGSISLVRASVLHLGTDVVDDSTRERLIAHFQEDARQDCNTTLNERFWGSCIYIVAMAHWARETIYVWDVLPDSAEYQVLCRRFTYHADRAAVTEDILSITEMEAELSIHIANEVLPMILVLHQIRTAEGGNASHFTALRVSQTYYSRWARTTALLTAMQGRRAHVMHTILKAPGSAPRPPDHAQDTLSPATSASSGYHPTDPTEATEEPTSAAAHESVPAAAADAALVAPSFALLVPAVVGNTTSPQQPATRFAPPAAEVASARESTPSSLLSTPDGWSQLLPSATSSPVTPLTTEDLAHLLECMSNPLHKLDEGTAATMGQAMAANALGYSTWRSSLTHANPALAARLALCDTIPEACARLTPDAVGIVHLLRALPYPRVQLASLNDKLLVRLGRTVACAARLQLLHRLASSSELDAAMRAFCGEWLATIEADIPHDVRVALIEMDDRWQRLRGLRLKSPLPETPSRVNAIVSRDNWSRLMVFAVADPSQLPRVLRDLAAPHLMDALLGWLAAGDRLDATAVVASSLAQRDWDALAVLCPEEHTPYLPPQLRARALHAEELDARSSDPGPDGPDRS